MWMPLGHRLSWFLHSQKHLMACCWLPWLVWEVAQDKRTKKLSRKLHQTILINKILLKEIWQGRKTLHSSQKELWIIDLHFPILQWCNFYPFNNVITTLSTNVCKIYASVYYLRYILLTNFKCRFQDMIAAEPNLKTQFKSNLMVTRSKPRRVSK